MVDNSGDGQWAIGNGRWGIYPSLCLIRLVKVVKVIKVLRL